MASGYQRSFENYLYLQRLAPKTREAYLCSVAERWSPVNLKHQALLTTIYASGLRVSEAVMLRPEHIKSSRMMIRVEQGKGVAVNRERHFALPSL
jgi:site-specific recombinase XerD